MNNRLFHIFISLILSITFAYASENTSSNNSNYSFTSNSNIISKQSLKNDDQASSKVKVNESITDAERLKNFLANPEYFTPQEPCRNAKGEDKPAVVENFQLVEFKPSVVSLSAAPDSNINQSIERLFTSDNILVNDTVPTQPSITTPEFSKSYSQRTSAATNIGWNFGGSVNPTFVLPGFNIQVSYNTGSSQTVESATTEIFTSKGSPIMLPPESYALVHTTLDKTTLNGTYNFVQKMTGTMSVTYKLYCNGNEIPATYSGVSRTINYFLQKNYATSLGENSALPGLKPTPGLTSQYFTLTGNGSYQADVSGANFHISVHNCPKTSEKAPCSIALYCSVRPNDDLCKPSVNRYKSKVSDSIPAPKPDLRSPF